MDTPFLKPEEVRQREEKVPISARVSKQTRDYLETKAKEAKVSTSNLVSHTLESYSSWLRQNEPIYDSPNFDLERVRLKFEMTEAIRQYEYDDYISFFDGSIFYTDEDREKIIQLIGKIRIRIWHLESAQNNGESLYPIFDHEDSDTASIYEALIDEDHGVFKEGLLSENNFKHDLMYIESIEIVPEFRGNHLGHFAVLRSMQKLGQACAAVIISPAPWVSSNDKNWEKRLRLGSFVSDRASAEKKLRKYWSKIGFELTTEKAFMIFDMENFPQLSELFKQEG